jgi:hypothetical protein
MASRVPRFATGARPTTASLVMDPRKRFRGRSLLLRQPGSKSDQGGGSPPPPPPPSPRVLPCEDVTPAGVPSLCNDLDVDRIYHPSIFTNRGRGNTRQEGSPCLTISSVASDVAPVVPAITDLQVTDCLDESNAAIDNSEESTLPDEVSNLEKTLDHGLECRCIPKPKDSHKRKARRKAARKRTPQSAILPQKRMLSGDDIQENIQQLNHHFFTIKAKRRRLYVKEQNMHSDQNPRTDRAGTFSTTAADRDDPLHRGDQPVAITSSPNGHAAPSSEHPDGTLPSNHPHLLPTKVPRSRAGPDCIGVPNPRRSLLSMP